MLFINTEHLNKDNLGKQGLGFKEKTAFVPSNKNITELNKPYSVSLCLHTGKGKSLVNYPDNPVLFMDLFSSSGGCLPSLIPF